MSSATTPSKKYAVLNTCCFLTTELYHQLIPSQGRGLGLKRKTSDKRKGADTEYSLKYHQSCSVGFQTVLRGTCSFVQQLRPDLRRISHFLWYHFVRVLSSMSSLTPWLHLENFNSFGYKLQQLIRLYCSVSNSPINFRCIYFQSLSSVVFQLKWIKTPKFSVFFCLKLSYVAAGFHSSTDWKYLFSPSYKRYLHTHIHNILVYTGKRIKLFNVSHPDVFI
jgi:hypothetical protein